MNQAPEKIYVCEFCNQPIPDLKLGCPRCVSARGYQALLDFQRNFIDQIKSGKSSIRIYWEKEARKWHMALSGYPQAWCGHTLNTRWKHKVVAYPKIERIHTPLCERCEEVFDEMEEHHASTVASAG